MEVRKDQLEAENKLLKARMLELELENKKLNQKLSSTSSPPSLPVSSPISVSSPPTYSSTSTSEEMTDSENLSILPTTDITNANANELQETFLDSSSVLTESDFEDVETATDEPAALVENSLQSELFLLLMIFFKFIYSCQSKPQASLTMSVSNSRKEKNKVGKHVKKTSHLRGLNFGNCSNSYLLNNSSSNMTLKSRLLLKSQMRLSSKISYLSSLLSDVG